MGREFYKEKHSDFEQTNLRGEMSRAYHTESAISDGASMVASPVKESAPMGMAQGGIKDWFRGHFTHKGRVARRAAKAPMADMNTAMNGIFAGAGEAPQMAPNAMKAGSVSHEEFQHQKNIEALRGVFDAMQNPVAFQDAQPEENYGAGVWTMPDDMWEKYTSEEIYRMEKALGFSVTAFPYRFRDTNH